MLEDDDVVDPCNDDENDDDFCANLFLRVYTPMIRRCVCIYIVYYMVIIIVVVVWRDGKEDEYDDDDQ